MPIPSPLSELRHLSSHLWVTHSLLTVESLDHLDRCTHIGGELEHADTFRDSHGGISMPERIGDAGFASGIMKDACLAKYALKPLLEASNRTTIRVAKYWFVSVQLLPALINTKLSEAINIALDARHTDYLALSCLASYGEDDALLSVERIGA